MKKDEWGGISPALTRMTKMKNNGAGSKAEVGNVGPNLYPLKGYKTYIRQKVRGQQELYHTALL